MSFEAKPHSLLTFRVGPVLCCAPSLPVRSIITPPKLTQPPGSNSSQPGIFKYSSHIVKVHDLRQKFGIEKTEQTQPGNFIICIFKTKNIAFWVDQILDVFDFPSKGWGDLPAAIPRGIFSRTLLLNNKIHLYAEFENLAALNDLGYLRHYIQQFKKQQDTQVIDKQEKDKAKNLTSPIKLNESKPKLKQENINTTALVNKPPKPVNETALKKQNVVHTPVTPTHETDTPLSAIKKTTQEKPAIDTHHITQQKLNRNEKPIASIKASASSASTIEANETNNEPSSLRIILFFVFLLISLATGIYYLFINTTSVDIDYQHRKKEITSPLTEYAIGKAAVQVEKELESTASTYNKLKIESELTNKQIENNNKAVKHENKKTKIEFKQEVEETLPIENHSRLENTEDTAYQANITQQDNDITITLHEDASAKTHQQEASLNFQHKNKVTSEVSAVINPIEKNMQPPLRKEKVSREIIHIIVKGDTLWAIAKRYVQDPFLYPELARLSKINNPHRIYPGNRVRIRFIKN